MRDVSPSQNDESKAPALGHQLDPQEGEQAVPLGVESSSSNSLSRDARHADIVQALRKDFTLRTEKELAEEKSRIGRECQIKGMFHSTPHVKALLRAEFEHKGQLRDHILAGIQERLPNASICELEPLLLGILDEEYDKMASSMEKYLKSRSMDSSVTLSNTLIAREKVRAKEIVEAKVVVSNGGLSSRGCTVFISHANEDEALAAALKAEMDGVFGKALDVFVSSIPGAIPPGTEWFDQILAQLRAARALVFVTTRVSQRKPFVWFELGFSWLRRLTEECDIYAVYAPPVEPAQLLSPLERIQAISLSDEQQVEAFFRRLVERFGFGNLNALNFARIRSALQKYDQLGNQMMVPAPHKGAHHDCSEEQEISRSTNP